MAKPDWGAKHLCQDCGAKYYDLNRSPIICPKCGTEFKADTLLRSRRSRPAPVAKAPEPKPAPKAEIVDAKDDETAALEEDGKDLPEVEDSNNDAAGPIEDVSELGEDDDDIVEVVVEGEKEDT